MSALAGVQNPPPPPKNLAQVIATNMLALSGIMGIDLRSYGSVFFSSVRSLEDGIKYVSLKTLKALTSLGVGTRFVSFAWSWEVNI